MTREEQINFITLTLNKICEAELGQVNASKWDGKAIKTTDTKVIATELYEKGLQIVESDDVVISKYEYDFLKNNQNDGRPDGATNLLIKMHETDLLKEFVEWLKDRFDKRIDKQIAECERIESEGDDGTHLISYEECVAHNEGILTGFVNAKWWLEELDTIEKFMEERK